MSIIEEIKRDVRHDDDCDALPFVSITGTAYTEHPADDARCNCRRRRKIAWLGRQEETIKQGERICAALVDGRMQGAHREAARYCLLVDQMEAMP